MKESQETQILSWLQGGNTLTPLEALDRFNTLRLGGRIWDLREKGYDIKTRMVKTRSGKEVAEYYLPAPSLEKPIFCPRCTRELIPSLSEEKRDSEVDAWPFRLNNEMVCEECFEDDPVELEYRRADAA
jgi:hypothetical protein